MTEKNLREISRGRRKYVNFYEWPDKQDKEREVVECLLEGMEKNGEICFFDLRPGPSPNQAPDCVVDDEAGKTVAIEVTEFVSRKAIEMNQTGKEVYRNWKPEEVIDEIQRIITRKDCVTYCGGPYSKTILIIHTDEIVLDHELYSAILSEASFKVQKVDEAYLLFSYRPQTETCPFVKLNISMQG